MGIMIGCKYNHHMKNLLLKHYIKNSSKVQYDTIITDAKLLFYFMNFSK